MSFTVAPAKAKEEEGRLRITTPELEAVALKDSNARLLASAAKAYAEDRSTFKTH
jgi:hypothetical protein